MTITNEEILSVVREADEQTQQQLRVGVDRLDVRDCDLQRKLDLIEEIKRNLAALERKVDLLANTRIANNEDSYIDLKTGIVITCVGCPIMLFKL